jgi:nicotinamide phosphoribosyltransferase
MKRKRPETCIDGYKGDHIHQYDPETTLIFSNCTARSTRRNSVNKIVYAGGQYFIKDFLIDSWNENFFNLPKEEVVARFARRINNYLGPNNVGTEHIEKLHDLGYLPIEIWSLPEGTEYPIKIPCLVIWNTLPEFFWVTNYLETILSTSLWGICTSATTALQYKKLLNKFALETVGNTDFVQWQAHDFSFRGMFGYEAACLSGAGHLFSFTGTDTIPAIDFLEDYYNADCEKELIGGSVAATEHSVACSVILNFVNKTIEILTKDGVEIVQDDLMDIADIEYVRYLIQDVYPEGIVSIVADSFDYWNTITKTARSLKEVIISRNGKVVFRPDTGDPVKVVCGYTLDEIDLYKLDLKGSHYRIKNTDIEVSQEEIKGSIECLWEVFEGKINNKGYKELDPHVGLIYGDSITLERAEAICQGLKDKGFASTNIVFGIGSYTYQYVTRDTDGYAVKATYAEINGKPLEIYKAPKGAEFKKSAKGLTAVFKDENGEFYLKDQATWEEVKNCEFIKVFSDGKLIKDYTLQEVRDNIAKYL